MPTPLVKKLAADSGESISRVEHLWSRAKRIVKKEYDYSEDSGRFWKLVYGITKKMLKLNETSLSTFSDFIKLEESINQFINEDRNTVFTALETDEFITVNVDLLKTKLTRSGIKSIANILISGDSELEITVDSEDSDTLHKLDTEITAIFGNLISGVALVKPGEYTVKFKQKVLAEV
jgi:hypothetical protein